MSGKEGATLAIERAQYELEEALTRLATVSNVDSDRLTYATHALSNYLMVVSAITQVLRAGMGKLSESQFTERLDALAHATHLMKEMVRELQDQQLSDRPKLQFLAVDLRVIVRAACDEYESVAAAKQITLVRDVAADAITVWSDRIALGAVLDNILSNAIKYSTPGGTVRIRAYAAGGEGVVAITDAGPGISEADAPRVFTRGAKLSSRPTAGERSTGYGLAIAKDLIDALRGRIWFENEAAGGATFSIAVPLHD